MKLNFRTLAYFASGLIMIAAPIALIKSSHYTPRFEENGANKKDNQSWEGAAEYYNLLKADPKTGLIDQNARMAGINEANARMASSINQKTSGTSALGLNWTELGPDNVGGRTRAICFDKNNKGVIYAGGNSGGVFKSINGGSTWSPINDQLSNMVVNCMSQDATGNNIYFGTGEGQGALGGTGNSAFYGAGLFKLNLATNAVTLVTTTSGFTLINKVVCHKTDANTIYLATDGNGFKITNDGGVTWHSAISTSNNLPVASSGNIADVKLATDGSYIFSNGSNLYISNKGDDFVSDITPTVITANNRVSVEIAISPSNPNVIYLGCVNTTGKLGGVAQSVDKGLTWVKIAQSSSTTFDPYISASGQGFYDNCVTVNPNDPYQIFLGGVSFYTWIGNSAGAGNWVYAAYQFAVGSQVYVHSDLHTLEWDPFNSSTLFIGGDGGISRTTDAGKTYVTINKGFNVTQPYAIAFERYPTGGLNGIPVGGAVCGNQDNGTTYVSGAFNGSKGSYPVNGGDGNYCEISHSSPTSIFTSIYYGQVFRAATLAQNGGSSFYDTEYGSAAAGNNGGPGANGFASFVTPISLWENMNDVTSIDSVDFIATSVKNSSAGAGNGSAKIFKSKTTKTYNSSIFDSLYVTVGTATASVNYTAPNLTYTALTGAGVVTRREYYYTLSGNASTVTATSFNGNNDYDSLKISFNSALASGSTLKTELTQKYLSGASVTVNAKGISGGKFWYNLPSNLASRTAARIPEIMQARLAVGVNSKVFVVKKPLNFSITPDWVLVASSLSKDETDAVTGFSGVVQTMAWSPNGDHLYVGCKNGSVYRISHLRQLRDSIGDKSSKKGVDSLFNGINTTANASNTLTPIRCTRIGMMGNVVTSISVNPLNGQDIVVTTGSYSNPKVYYSATPETLPTANNTSGFIDKMGVGSTGLIANAPIYSSLIEYKDTKRVIVGTEFGVYGTSDITAATPIWTKENNNKLPNVPVFMLRQQTYHSAACYNSGMIYAGTHGRGIWTSDTYYNQSIVGIQEITPNDKTVVSAIKLYPNPARENVSLSFNIEKSEPLVLNVYDLKGGLVISKNLGKLPEGEQLMQIGTEDLISGTYIVSLNSNSAIIGTSRLVVVK